MQDSKTDFNKSYFFADLMKIRFFHHGSTSGFELTAVGSGEDVQVLSVAAFLVLHFLDFALKDVR